MVDSIILLFGDRGSALSTFNSALVFYAVFLTGSFTNGYFSQSNFQ